MSSPATQLSTLHCDRCGYDLRGTPPEGRCPECGRPVAESIRAAARPALLRYADPLRLRWVVLGAWLLVGYAIYEAVEWATGLLTIVDPTARRLLFVATLGVGFVGGGLLFVPVFVRRDGAGSGRLLSWMYAAGAGTFWSAQAARMAGVPVHLLLGPATVPMWYLSALAFNVAGFLQLSALCRRLPSRRLRAACVAMAVLSVAWLLVSTEAFVRSGGKYAHNGQTPLFLDAKYALGTAWEIHTNVGDGNPVWPTIHHAVTWQIEYGQSLDILLSPLAFAVVAWFAVRATRAWLAARRGAVLE